MFLVACSVVSYWGEFHCSGEKDFGVPIDERNYRVLYTFIIGEVVLCMPLTLPYIPLCFTGVLTK